MADSFKFSLYELFGYVFPGCVTGIALLMADWAIVHPVLVALPASALTKTGLSLALVAAYILGHSVQALANLVLQDATVLILKRKGAAWDILSRVRCDLPEHLANFSDAVLVALFEQQFQNRGPSPEREIYVYREGFCKGMMIALVFLTASLLLLAARAPHLPFLLLHDLNRCEILAGAILVCVMAAGMYRRSIRFANYRIVPALMTRLLTIEEDHGTKEPQDVVA